MKYVIIAIIAYALYQANQPSPAPSPEFSPSGDVAANSNQLPGADGTSYGIDYIRPPKTHVPAVVGAYTIDIGTSWEDDFPPRPYGDPNAVL
jgi:hypothetical protein